MRDTLSVRNRGITSRSKRCSTSVSSMSSSNRGSEPATTSAITALFSRAASHPASACCRVETTQPRDDDFGGQEIFLDEAAQTLGYALLVLRNDGGVRDRDPARVPEQCDDGIPVRNRTDRTRLGKSTRPREPRMLAPARPRRRSAARSSPRADRSPSCACASSRTSFLSAVGSISAAGHPVAPRHETQLASCRRNRSPRERLLSPA